MMKSLSIIDNLTGKLLHYHIKETQVRNVIVEFGSSLTNINVVCIVNLDALKTTNDHPMEARLAGALEYAMESKEKGGSVPYEVYAAFHASAIYSRIVVDPPCQVIDHLIMVVAPLK
jgi:hypothetical protein